MPHFAYKAVTPTGEVIEGRMEAANKAGVIARLEDQGHLPVTAEEVSAKAGGAARPARRGLFRRGVTRAQLATLTRELARLTGAGVPLEKSPDIAVGVAETPAVERLTRQVLEGIRGGGAMADVLEAVGPPFDRVYVNMIRAGEVGGTLEVVLGRLAEHMARMRQLQANVASALIYPAILLAVSLLSLVMLLVFVVPQFETLFADAGAALPLPTQIVVAVAHAVRDDWWVPLVALLAALVIGPRLYRVEKVRLAWDGLVLGLPLIGGIVRRIEVARFCRTLGALVTNGVPLLRALTVVRESMGNAVMARAVGAVADSLKVGQGLAQPLLQAKEFPKLAAHMVRVGEETGNLDVMLHDVAAIYDEEVEQSLKKLLALLEPFLILTLGVMMGGIIISILVAILGVNELAF